MPTKISYCEELQQWWGLCWLCWSIKRPWCWIVGHDVHVLPGEYRPDHNTHFCTRCLLFWEQKPSKEAQ